MPIGQGTHGTPDQAFPPGSDLGAAAAPAPDGQLKIVVLAGGRPLPVADVHVYRHGGNGLGGNPWSLSAKGVTDVTGILHVAAAPGAYLVTAAARGLARAYAEAARPVGEGVTTVELHLEPGATVVGRTVERRGEAAIPLVELSFSPAPATRFRRFDLPVEERAFAISDERGMFRLGGIAAGRWRVEARAPGHAPADVSVVVPAAQELRIELGGAASIEGLVTRHGEPVSRATVTVTGATEPVVAYSGPTGGFLAEVDPGSHHVLARSGDETGAAAEAIVVAAGTHARGIEVRLGPAARIGGSVRSAAGPVQGATVSASPYTDSGSLARAVTSESGSYELSGLAPGSYTVTVTARGRATATYSGITVRSGERFPLNPMLVDPNAVEGTVTDSSGTPVSGALVTAAGGWFRGRATRGEASDMAARTDSSGRFRLEGVPAGPLRISARRDEASPASSRMVTVEEGGASKVDLVLADGGLIVGTVLDSRSNPISGAIVSAADPSTFARGGGVPPVNADGSGSYLLALPPGTYALRAWRPDTVRTFGTRNPALARASVTVGERAEVNLIVPDEPSPTIAGQVLEPGGAPSPGAMIRVGAAGPGAQLVSAESDGTFAISVPGADATTVSARNGGRTGSATVTPPVSGVLVQLQLAAVLQGKLVGDPAPDTFSITASTTGAVPGAPTQVQLAGDSFLLQDVAPGLVALHATTDDGRVGDTQVSVAPGETKSVDVVLSPAATVTGRVVDATTGQLLTRGRVLVDGVARRGGIGADGRFRRTVSAGGHVIGVNVPGYAPVSRPVTARAGAPNDLGDLPLSPVPGQSGP
jgi:protocatechuate 3,4-dioxygenase beta subunit